MLGRFWLTLIGPAQQAIPRASDSPPAAIEDVRGNHGRADVIVSQQFLHGADVVARSDEVWREAVAEGVRRHAFREIALPDRSSAIALETDDSYSLIRVASA